MGPRMQNEALVAALEEELVIAVSGGEAFSVQKLVVARGLVAQLVGGLPFIQFAFGFLTFAIGLLLLGFELVESGTEGADFRRSVIGGRFRSSNAGSGKNDCRCRGCQKSRL